MPTRDAEMALQGRRRRSDLVHYPLCAEEADGGDTSASGRVDQVTRRQEVDTVDAHTTEPIFAKELGMRFVMFVIKISGW
jgi:hypothetical protein